METIDMEIPDVASAGQFIVRNYHEVEVELCLVRHESCFRAAPPSEKSDFAVL
jgi:hypothetical protein